MLDFLQIINREDILHMDKEKRDNYTLNGSYHTIEIKSEEPTVTDSASDCITTRINKSRTIATSIINPNKYDGDIFKFSEFKNTFSEILKENGIENYRITRADMRFDNYDKSHYLAFAKLNKYIISALMVTYEVKNRYRTVDLVTDDQLTIAIKNDYFEIENYDRERKNEITGNTVEPAKARLEERTKSRQWRKLNDGVLCFSNSDYNMELLKTEFTNGWSLRWDKAKENLELVQDTYNDALLKKYREGKNARPVQFRTLTDFLIQNQNSIFTSMQMVNLLNRLKEENPELPYKNAETRAKYHKRKYGIEYFSKTDVNYAIKEIKRATKEYFKN